MLNKIQIEYVKFNIAIGGFFTLLIPSAVFAYERSEDIVNFGGSVEVPLGKIVEGSVVAFGGRGAKV
ncbi:MAG: hypothetical protein AB1466_05085 [Actinomycetota bacterium]